MYNVRISGYPLTLFFNHSTKGTIVNKKAYERFVALMEVIPPKPRNQNAMIESGKNWFLLHPELAALPASEFGLNKIREYMWIELNREEGPRHHIMDRLYKRFSNLRREIETNAMMALLPAVEEVGEE